MIRNVNRQDADTICKIYNYYVENTVITFEEIGVTRLEMEQRINTITKDYPWIVYEVEGKIAGYAYATMWKAKSAYRFAVESTVYVDLAYQGQKIGKQLYKELMIALREQGKHCVIAGISMSNETSISMHEKMGFEKVAEFKEVGFKFNQWIDVGYWQYNLTNLMS